MAAIMEWFKVNGYNLVYGSLRLDPPMHQLIFIKLLAMSSISRVSGTVCIANKVPYPEDVLAATLGVSQKELEEAITYNCDTKQNRIRKNDWGGLEIINWQHYQSKGYLRVKKYRERKRRNADDNTNETLDNKKDNERREEKRIEEKRIEKKNIYKKKHPSKEEFLQYIKENKLSIQNPESLWQGYQDGGWVDTQGKPVKNWKLKLRTLHNFAQKEDIPKKQKLLPIVGKHCSEPGCGMPAVYKWSSSAGYDFWCCSKHLPEKVKEVYA